MDQEEQTLQVQIDKIVYKKAMLHSCKYSSDDVIGILIGNMEKGIEIVNAFPLFHSRVVLPTLEVALDLISGQLQKNQQIIGIYEARSNPSGIMSDIAHELLNNINCKGVPILLKISQIEIEDEYKLLAKVVSEKENYKYVINESSKIEWDTIKDYLKQGLHWQIVDFDAHFENAEMDYRNKYLE